MINDSIKDTFKAIMLSKGYPFFEKGDYNLNIIGIRSDIKVANNFDDFLVLLFKIKDEWQYKSYNITTDCGSYYLKNPLNSSGSALLKPNCYRSTYAIDLHNNSYTALCQRLKKVAVYRDDNKNQILDFDEDSVEWGMFGINLHRSRANGTLDNFLGVDKYSAGCQVFESINEFDSFMNLVGKSADLFGNSFTYTLLTYKDFEK